MTLNLKDQKGESGRTDPSPAERRGLVDELLDELTVWPSRERVGAFKQWHRGAFSLVHLNVLTVLELQGPLSMSHLAEALDVSLASATGIVSRMEQRGLVERRHATDDRRVVMVVATPPGADVFRKLERTRREHLSAVLGELSDAELAGFLLGLRAMRAARARLLETERADASAATDPAGPPDAGPAAHGRSRPRSDPLTPPPPAAEMARP